MLTLEENRSLYRRLPDTFVVFIALVPGGSETREIQPALSGQWLLAVWPRLAIHPEEYPWSSIGWRRAA
jgi:hypothetical protein